MEAVNGSSLGEDKGGPPPPSPLTGCYLLVVVGEPHSEEHKDIILQKVAKGKNIFITGGSGFLGKALIEKLLRSCPDIGSLYILLRPKRGKSLDERIEQIVSCPLFQPLRQLNPNFAKKIIPINGDASQCGLGISDEDRRKLIEEVHVFYHAAASVKFDDFLKYAIFINVRSAREAAMLALEMKKIEVFVHVSTTYCNIANKKVIEEILYPAPGNWKEAIEVAELYDTEILNILSRKYIENFPNTYTYTKLLAEHCVNDLLLGKVPAVICRPSIVISTIADPFQGWVDNFNGPVGLLLAGASGLLRTVYGNPGNEPDYMPVDNVVKVIIVAGWHKANIGNKDDLSVYHASKYDLLRFRQDVFVELGKRLRWDVPFERKIWFPVNNLTNCWYHYFLNVLLFHLLPAAFLDLILKVTGYKPILFKIQRKIYIAIMAVSHFALNDWYFVNTKAVGLYDRVAAEEKEEFNFLVVPTDDQTFYNYYLTSCDYSRRYLMKEYKDITDETRAKTKRMYYLDRAVKFLFACLTVWILFFKVNILGVAFRACQSYWDSL